MLVVHAAHGSGRAALARVLQHLGCRVEQSPLVAVEDCVAMPAPDWADAGADAVRAKIAPELIESARAVIAAAPDLTAYVEPRLCFSLPVWRSLGTEPLVVFLHQHPWLVAREIERELGAPIPIGLAAWQVSTLAALRNSAGVRRVLVRHDELVRTPSEVVAALREVLRGRGSWSVDTAERDAPIALDRVLEEDGAEPQWDAALTGAQRALHESLAAGRWPDLEDIVDPAQERIAREMLQLWRAARARDLAPAPITLELARELGRARAHAAHHATRARLASARAEALEVERTRAELELADLRGALDHERAARVGADDLGLSQRSSFGSTQARLEHAKEILDAFERTLFSRWTEVVGRPHSGLGVARPLRVMVGTLSSDENELEQCVASVRRQTYRQLSHDVFSGLGKKESIATLMRAFQRSGCDLLIKVDADMVLTAPDFVERIVRVFQANPDIDLLCVAILDFFSGGPIQGINAYRSTAAWSEARQDALFTDKTQVPDRKRLVVWPTFVRDAVHAPNPSPFQAFHFGVHRGLKTLQPGSRVHATVRGEEQLVYLERTWAHFELRRDPRLALACLGFELALTGRFELEELDYTNPSLRAAFDELDTGDVREVERMVRELREARVASEPVANLRARRTELLERQRAPIERILVLLPHTRVYGGVNRFFELARELGRLGVTLVIAQPDHSPTVATRRSDYPDVEVRAYSDAIADEWDVVLCGDASGGVMLTMPLFRARLAAVYLLNGWERSPLNAAQIAVVDPEVVVANSSYAAAQYAGLAPAVVPGGVDLETFRPAPRRSVRTTRRPVKVCAYPGRRKPSKRFEDTVEACEILTRRGLAVELHAFDHGTLWIDTGFPVVFHGALEKAAVRELLWDVDVMVCAEEDGGWSNPAAEAMACGAPLVCTEAGTTDFALHEETALVVPTRAPQAIADAIERLHCDPALAQRLREEGLERIRRFGWPQVARGLIDVLGDARLDREARASKNARALERLAALGVRRGRP